MEADEDATLAAWWVARKEIIDPIIARHAGRIVKHTGDGFLAEFNTVLDAVQSAIAMQAELAAQNADVPGDRRLDFRMGINLGDIVVDDEDIYGDGVNIAARLEALAEPGGICVSAAVYNQVDNKLDVAFEDMGEQAVKNIVKAVRAYRVRPPRHARRTRGRARTHAARRWTWAAVAALAVAVMVGTAGYLGVFPLRPPTPRTDAGPALSLPDKPSIAVLPFTNMSGDPEQEYFSDGITEDIITDLSKSPALFVIARNSSFVYKERAVDVRRVGEELGVRYVLEGSVRKANDSVRITAQLVDAASGTHLWAERYDRDLKDIFAVQEEVAHEILSALVAKLKVAGPGARGRTLIENLEAYDLYLRGMEFYRRHTKEANAEARRLLAKAIELDPGFARAYSALGWTHFLDWALQWSHDTGSLDHALDLAQSAIGLNPFQANAYHLLSHVYLWRKQHEQAIAAAEKAIALDPGNADSYAELGEVLAWSGRPEETIELVRKAMRLDPHHPMYYSWNIGHAYRLTGRFEEAIEAQRNALARNPDFLPSHAELAVNYGELGREKEQRAAVAECLRISPDITTVRENSDDDRITI